MSFLGRLAKGLGTAALTGNMGAGVMAAVTNNFTLSTMAGISDNLLNSQGMNYGMQQYGQNPFGMNQGYQNGAITGCFGNNLGMNQGGYQSGYQMGMQAGSGSVIQNELNRNNWNQFSPFNNGFGYNPVNHNMWTNTSIW